MKNLVAVNTNSYHGFSVDEALEGIAKAGFKYVEISAVPVWTGHILPTMEEAEIQRIEKKVRDLGLELIGMSGHCNLMEKERLEDFRENIKLAHRLGIKYIVSSTGEAHFGKGETFRDDVLIENIKTLVPMLEKYDMQMVLETHGQYGTGESLKKIAEGTGSDRVGVCYDTANVVFYGNVRPEEEIRKCMDRVKYFHLKDKIGYDNVWNFPAVGQGELKLLDVIAYANEQGFHGPFSMEVEYTEDFTMRDKRPGDLEYVNEEMVKAYRYMEEHGII